MAGILFSSFFVGLNMFYLAQMSLSVWMHVLWWLDISFEHIYCSLTVLFDPNSTKDYAHNFARFNQVQWTNDTSRIHDRLMQVEIPSENIIFWLKLPHDI